MSGLKTATAGFAAPPLRRTVGTLPPLPSIAVELYDGADLDGAEWPAVAARPDLEMNVFQAREFLEVWMRTVGRARGARPFLVVVRDRECRGVLYLPLAIEKHFNVSLLRFLDAGLSDFNAPVLTGDRSLTAAEFAAVWREFLASLPPVDVIDLQKMPAAVNGRRNPLTYLPCREDATCGFAIDLVALHTVHRRPSIMRLRKKLDRQLRRLSEQGPAEFIVNPSGGQLAAVTEALFSLKRDQYLRTFGHDLFAVPGVDQFYREMVWPEKLGRVSHLSALLCGGTVVSAHLGLVGRRRFHYLMPAYDPLFRSLAPGHLLLDYLMTRCADDGFAVFDLGEGNFAYKRKWATATMVLARHEKALTVRGRIYLEARRLRRRFTEFSGGKQAAGHPEGM